MTWNINLVVEGERPTLLHTDKANEVIKALQALSNISIKKGSRDEPTTQSLHWTNVQ